MIYFAHEIDFRPHLAKRLRPVNMRQQYWDAILQAEGLGVIDFASRSFVPSAAAEHEARTSQDKNHPRDPEALALLREILATNAIPTSHRKVLYAFTRGVSLREIATAEGISKDTAHRLVLRYIGSDRHATRRELRDIRPRLPLDARRARLARRSSRARTCTSTAHLGSRPTSESEATAAYFELGRVFAEHFAFQWELDREIWSLHIAGMPRRKIARELGMPDTTVQRAILRAQRGFTAWLKTRPREREESDHAHIRAMFEALSNHERY